MCLERYAKNRLEKSPKNQKKIALQIRSKLQYRGEFIPVLSVISMIS